MVLDALLVEIAEREFKFLQNSNKGGTPWRGYRIAQNSFDFDLFLFGTAQRKKFVLSDRPDNIVLIYDLDVTLWSNSADRVKIGGTSGALDEFYPSISEQLSLFPGVLGPFDDFPLQRKPSPENVYVKNGLCEVYLEANGNAAVLGNLQGKLGYIVIQPYT